MEKTTGTLVVYFASPCIRSHPLMFQLLHITYFNNCTAFIKYLRSRNSLMSDDRAMNPCGKNCLICHHIACLSVYLLIQSFHNFFVS